MQLISSILTAILNSGIGWACFIVFAIALIWILIFSLLYVLRSCEMNTLVTITSIIVLCAQKQIWIQASDLFISLSRFNFQIIDKNAIKQGEILLSKSPLRVPVNTDSHNYCATFSYSDGSPVKVIISLVERNVTYCGYYWRLLEDKDILIPFKILANGKAEYWTRDGSIIIGAPPKL